MFVESIIKSSKIHHETDKRRICSYLHRVHQRRFIKAVSPDSQAKRKKKQT